MDNRSYSQAVVEELLGVLPVEVQVSFILDYHIVERQVVPLGAITKGQAPITSAPLTGIRIKPFIRIVIWVTISGGIPYPSSA
jgi:hypothetical protein